MTVSDRHPILAGIFFLSGFAALLYQVSWQRLLSVYYGVGPISTAIVVSVFMLGLGAGALIGGRLAAGVRRPIVIYLLVESGIGLFGLASMPLLAWVGSHTAGSDYWLTLVCIAGFLLLPTILMGTTLPLVLRILQDMRDDKLGNLSYYYFLNTVGAAFGAVFGSYVLISFLGIDRTVFVAVLTNLALGFIILLVRRTLAAGSRVSTPTIPSRVRQIGSPGLAVLLFVNGFFAIGYQMIWYRIVGVLLKDSAYSFSTILAVYLLGIGLGSLWVNRRERLQPEPAPFRLYLRLNALIGMTALIPVILIHHGTDLWPFAALLNYGHGFPILPALGDAFVPTLGLVFLWPAVVVLLPTFFMGAAFPVGLSLFGRDAASNSSAVGKGYAVTIAGNTLGGLLSAFVLLPNFGTSSVLLGFALIQMGCPMVLDTARHRLRWQGLALAAALGVTLLVPRSEPLFLRLHPPQPAFAAHYREGVEGVMMAFERAPVLRNYINGSAHGGRPGTVFVNEAFTALGHAASPRRVLVIGFGTGALLDALLLDERIADLTLVELNRTALENLRTIPLASAGLRDPRVHIVIDDGRRYLERTGDSFDLIVMDPLRSRSAFSNNIYSAEFFGLVDRHLSGAGIFLVWTDDLTRRLDRGLAMTFPYVNRYPYFLVAAKSDAPPSQRHYRSLLAKLPADVAGDVERLYAPPLAGREELLRETSCLAAPTDLRPYLEYYLGDYRLGSNAGCNPARTPS